MAAIETLPPELSGRSTRFSSRRAAAPRFLRPQTALIVLFCTVVAFLAPVGYASDLKPATSAAFDSYISATESQMNSDEGRRKFLILDRLPDSGRQAAYDQVRAGEVYVEELHTRQGGRSISIPSGKVHHWAGVAFISQATLSDVLSVLNDYAHQKDIYKPDIRESKLVEQSGDDAKIFEQFYSKTIVTVVLDAYFDVVQTQLPGARVQTVSRSTRIVEVQNPEGSDELGPSDGKDHGYMWRLNSYWRIEEKDGGVYVQNESISLSRTVPVLLAWIIEPLTKSIPRDVLSRTLTHTRDAVESNRAKAAKKNPKPENPKEENREQRTPATEPSSH